MSAYFVIIKLREGYEQNSARAVETGQRVRQEFDTPIDDFMSPRKKEQNERVSS